MDKPFDVIALGECLVDFVCTEANGKLLMEGNPGGAPANVLAIAAKLGLSTAMVCKVGKDSFGSFLRGQIAGAGIDARYVLEDSLHPTTLAIVRLNEQGNRSFTFYRNQTADIMLHRNDLPLGAIQNARVLHFGALSLCNEPSREATFTAVQAARESGVCISYDPNLRPPLWENLALAKQMMLRGMALAHLAKISDEELFFLTEKAEAEAVAALFKEFPLALLAVTKGPGGCTLYTREKSYFGPAFNTPSVDTTGAGDAFWGACLTWLLEHGLNAGLPAPGANLGELLDFANAAGSLSTTRKGAIPAMPTREEIMRCIATVPRLV
ncbi:MAG: carbohydrate kinase family protein [Oscillospiraceae bacterium]